MPFEAKLMLFAAALAAALWWLARHPDSLLARIANVWHGPFPQAGETKSDFYRRQGRFALGWLLQFVVVCGAGHVTAWLWPEIADTEWFMIAFSFALPIAIGMAALGALLAWLCAFKAAVLGPNPEFVNAGDESDG